MYQDTCYYKIFGNCLELYDCYGDKKYVVQIFNEMGRIIDENSYIKYINIMNKLRPTYILIYMNYFRINGGEIFFSFLNSKNKQIINCPYTGKHNTRENILNYFEDKSFSIHKGYHFSLDINWCYRNTKIINKLESNCCIIS